jgi:hypothetical protein
LENWNDGKMEDWKIGAKPTRFAKPVRFFFEYVKEKMENWKDGMLE